jgi:hypothetical protein
MAVGITAQVQWMLKAVLQRAAEHCKSDGRLTVGPSDIKPAITTTADFGHIFRNCFVGNAASGLNIVPETKKARKEREKRKRAAAAGNAVAAPGVDDPEAVPRKKRRVAATPPPSPTAGAQVAARTTWPTLAVDRTEDHASGTPRPHAESPLSSPDGDVDMDMDTDDNPRPEEGRDPLHDHNGFSVPELALDTTAATATSTPMEDEPAAVTPKRAGGRAKKRTRTESAGRTSRLVDVPRGAGKKRLRY